MNTKNKISPHSLLPEDWDVVRVGRDKRVKPNGGGKSYES